MFQCDSGTSKVGYIHWEGISFTSVGGPPGENNLLLQFVILLTQLMGVCNNLKPLVGHSPVDLLQELKM